MSNKLPNLIKLFLFLAIYTLGKSFLSEKSILISSVLIIISIIIFLILKKFKINKNFNLNYILYTLFIYVFISQLYLINKYNLRMIDIWSITNINDWTQTKNFFINKENSYKNNVLILRKCDDFLLFPIVLKNKKAVYDSYINIISHKSVYTIDLGMYYYNYEKYSLNKKKYIIKNKLIKMINHETKINKIENIINLDNLVLFIDYEIFKSKFNFSEDLSQNIIYFDEDFILYVKNRDVRDNIANCKLNHLI